MSAHTRVFWDRPPLSVMPRKWVGHAEGEHLYCMAKGSCVVGNGVDAWCYFLSLSWKGHYQWASLLLPGFRAVPLAHSGEKF